MKIYIGTDHAGYETKEKLKSFLIDLGHEVIDKGPTSFDINDDYPDYIKPVAEAVSQDKDSRGIILGASGQGEAMCANRVSGVRAGLFYGKPPKNQTDASGHVLNMIASTRMHNNANVLSLGMRFISFEEAKEAVRIFLETEFSGDPRHIRRIKKLDY